MLTDDEENRRHAFDQALTMLVAAYNTGEFDPDRYRIYWLTVGRFQVSKILAGTENAIAAERYLPSPATLKLYIAAAHEPKAKPIAPAYQVPWHIAHLNDRDPATRAEARRQAAEIKAMVADLKAKFAKGTFGRSLDETQSEELL